MGFMQGKRALIVGIASQRSIAWGIAEAMHKQGAELAFTYQNDKLRSRVEEAAAAFGGGPVLPCDVGSDAEIDAVMEALGQQWGQQRLRTLDARRRQHLDSIVDQRHEVVGGHGQRRVVGRTGVVGHPYRLPADLQRQRLCNHAVLLG